MLLYRLLLGLLVLPHDGNVAGPAVMGKCDSASLGHGNQCEPDSTGFQALSIQIAAYT